MQDGYLSKLCNYSNEDILQPVYFMSLELSSTSCQMLNNIETHRNHTRWARRGARWGNRGRPEDKHELGNEHP